MPAALVMQPTINGALGAPGSPPYENLKSAAARSNNLLATVEAGGLLNGLTPAQQQEVRDILQDVPPGVDSQFMAAARAALGHDQRIQFSWAAHPMGGYDFHQATDAQGTLWLTLRTPPGTA